MTNVVPLQRSNQSIPLHAVLDLVARSSEQAQRQVMQQGLSAIATKMRELDAIALDYHAMSERLPASPERERIMVQISDTRALIQTLLNLCTGRGASLNQSSSNTAVSPASSAGI
jgi:hypothetical protein